MELASRGRVTARRARSFAGRVRRRLVPPPQPAGDERSLYRDWVAVPTLKRSQEPQPAGLAIVMAVHDPPIRFLREAIESVLAQTSGAWQLVLSDDGSTKPAVREHLDMVAASDPRVVLVRSPEGTGIGKALNRGVNAVTAPYLGVLDHDDRLHPHAVAMMLARLAQEPDLAVLYSDEDKITPDGAHFDPYFKPDFSPELLLGQMYLNHFTAMRTELVREVGAFREGTDGAQDHDLAFRLVRAGGKVGHLPGVLYHWRAWSGSTASGIQAKPWAQEAAARVQRTHLEAIGFPGSVIPSPIPGLNEVHPGIRGEPMVSVIIPTASALDPNGQPLVNACLATLAAASGHPNLEVIVVHTNEPAPAQRSLLEAAGAKVVVYRTDAFSFARAINLGAAAATGEYLLLLNDDTEIKVPGAVAAMLEFAQLPGVGVVGARMSFPDGRHQHCGMLMVEGLPTHPLHQAAGSDPGYFGAVITPRNYLAVTGAALMTQREVFTTLGGLDDVWPHDYQDVDYCLRCVESGLRIVYTPYAHFLHHEGASLPRDRAGAPDTTQFLSRWGARWAADPYYSVLLRPELPMLYQPR